MNVRWIPVTLVVAALCACGPRSDKPFEVIQKPMDKPETQPAETAPAPTKTGFDYPETRRGDTVDDYHGTRVPDPYRWMEDLDSPELKRWIEAQNVLTFGYLEKIPERDRIKERLTEIWNYERYGTPFKRGKRYFFYKNDGLQNHSVLYWTDSLDKEAKVLIDPNTLSEDGTVALKGASVSEDGKYLAYGLSKGGSDWAEWYVREVATGKDLDDHLKWIKFSGAAWDHDSEGFYYSRYPEPKEGDAYEEANYYNKLYYHKLGTPQSEDVLVHEDPDHKEWSFSSGVTDDGRYFVMYTSRSTDDENQLHVRDLKRKKSELVAIDTTWEGAFSVIGNKGSRLFVRTTLDAPRGRIVVIDVRRPQRKNWKEIVPQTEDALVSASAVGGRLFLEYLHDAHSLIRVHDLSGKHLRDVELPGLGSAGGFGGRLDDKETFYSFSSFTVPTEIYHYDIKSGKSTLFKRPDVDVDTSLYEARQVFYQSKDGTRVPMFIVHKKGLALDGNNPTLLYGYGGFNIPLTPSFSITRMAWIEMGGVFAMPNLRGGGEYGEEWHKAGTKLNKQNVFDDFIAAAEWLIDNKYTSPRKLAIQGRSNGGLLVGAVLLQRPELFGAALPGVGVMDMLRYHKFTIGWAWAGDYGTSDDPEEFKALYAYSPVHNARPARYPPTLIVTADTDDRVVPSHSFKFAAALQHAQRGDAPILIRIETRAGHGGLTPTTKKIEEVADEWAFLVENLGVELPE